MNNKAHLRPKDFDSNGDIIPMACKEEKDDLISREALKKAITEATYNFEQIPIRVDKVQEIIDNAPTVEAYTKEDMRKEYQRGITDAYRDNPPI